VCSKLGISEATFYSWKKKYTGARHGGSETFAPVGRKERAVERIVADLTLDMQMLQDVLKSSEAAAMWQLCVVARRWCS
jgi:putative transposase